MKTISILCGLLLLTGCAGQPRVSVQAGDDRWTQHLTETWKPYTDTAIQAFERFAEHNQLPRQNPAPHFLLTGDKTKLTASQSELQSIELKPSTGHRDAYRLSVLEPLEELLERAQQSLMQNRAPLVPSWLEDGAPVYLAGRIAQGIKGLPGDRLTHQKLNREIELRAKTAAANVELLLNPLVKDSNFDRHAHTWLVEQLAERTGPTFPQQWKRYFERAGKAGFVHEQAFKESFGLSVSGFIEFSNQRLDVLRNEQRSHATTAVIPPASNYARSDDLTVSPFKDFDHLRKGYEKYLATRAPKAFAFSPRGAWAYSDDDSQAIAHATEQCEFYDRLNCRLYAVDDTVVFTPIKPEDVKIIVQLATPRETDIWAESIRRNWLPVIESTARHFLAEVKSQTGTGLSSNTIIHVATTPESYAEILHKEMQILSTERGHFEQHATGVANGDGIIVVYLHDKIPAEQMHHHVAEVVLHELVHELQGQLALGHQGFRQAPWITEGSAEVLGGRIGSRLEGSIGEKFDLAERETALRHLFRLNAMPEPAKVFAADIKQWREFGGKDKLHYPAAEMMTLYLSQQTGERFLPGLASYFKRSGQKGEKEDSAFYLSFGLSKDEFLSGYLAWLKNIQNN